MSDDKNKQPGLSWSTPAAPAASPLMPAKAKADSTPAQKQIPQTQAPIYAGLLVGGIIVGVLLATAWSSFGKNGAVGSVATSTQATAEKPASTTTPLKGSSVGAPVVVSDQSAGSDVTIERLNITKPTWVVVYISREGAPGNALGARLFFPGDTKGQVALLRATEAGQNYFVGLRVDNGDRVFSLSKDLPVADADGGPLWATFSAR